MSSVYIAPVNPIANLLEIVHRTHSKQQLAHAEQALKTLPTELRTAATAEAFVDIERSLLDAAEAIENLVEWQTEADDAWDNLGYAIEDLAETLGSADVPR